MRSAKFMSDNDISGVSLEAHLERIALEAGFITNMVEAVKSILPDFRLSLLETTNSIKGLLDRADDLEKDLTKKQKAALEIADQLNFVVFAKRTITVPENFNGSLLKYTTTLLSLSNTFYTEAIAAVNEYDGILASYITNKDDKKALTNHSQFFKRIQKVREDGMKAVGVYFPLKNHRSRVDLSQVMDRFADLGDLYEKVNKLTDTHKRLSLSDLNNRVNHCVELLDIIIKDVQEGKVKTVSTDAVKNIAKGAYEVGQFVKAITAFYFDVTVLLNVVDGLTDTIIGKK